MPIVELNYFAILVAAVAGIIIGFVWYAKPLFGAVWMRMVGLTEESAKQNMGKAMTLMVLGVLVLAYVMAHFVDYTGAATFTRGMTTGFWAWLGFVAAVYLMDVAFARKPWKLYFITVGYYLVEFLVMGGILAAWR